MEGKILLRCNVCLEGYYAIDGHDCAGWQAPRRTTAEDLSTIQDPIYNPPHYAHTAPQPIEVIEAWDLGPHEANVIKYVLRAPYKDMELKDLQKARWYLDRKIWILEGKPKR